VLASVHTSVRCRVHILYTYKRTHSICAEGACSDICGYIRAFHFCVYSHIQCMRILCVPVSCAFVILICKIFRYIVTLWQVERLIQDGSLKFDLR
jgi:hypothetical protein